MKHSFVALTVIYCLFLPFQYLIEQFESDVFEVLMEYLHSGTLEVSSSVLPGLLCATQHFDVADLRQTCLDQSEQFITQHTVSLIPALF